MVSQKKGNHKGESKQTPLFEKNIILSIYEPKKKTEILNINSVFKSGQQLSK